MRIFTYSIRWLLYILSLTLFFTYSLLQFFSKPGTRMLFPFVLGVGIALYRDQLYQAVGAVAWIAWAGFALAEVILSLGYVFLSRSIGLVLGIFPPVTRPMAPIARLSKSKNDLSLVKVKIAVPRLRG